MKIITCIKQVPGITEVRIDKKTGTLVRQGIPSIINPMDKNALELALLIKEQTGAEVIALTMGPPQAEEALREAFSMGIDKGYLLTDREFAGADTLATSYTLACGIKKILSDLGDDKYLVICGAQAIDGDTAQVGPELAEELNIPQITNVQSFQIEKEKILVESVFRSEEIVVLETKLPALITVSNELGELRSVAIKELMAAQKKPITTLTAQELGIESDTKKRDKLLKIFIPKRETVCEIIKGETAEESGVNLSAKLRESEII